MYHKKGQDLLSLTVNFTSHCVSSACCCKRYRLVLVEFHRCFVELVLVILTMARRIIINTWLAVFKKSRLVSTYHPSLNNHVLQWRSYCRNAADFNQSSGYEPRMILYNHDCHGQSANMAVATCNDTEIGADLEALHEPGGYCIMWVVLNFVVFRLLPWLHC